MDHELHFANPLFLHIYQFTPLLLFKLGKLNTLLKTIKQWAGLWRSGLPCHSWWLVSGGTRNAAQMTYKGMLLIQSRVQYNLALWEILPSKYSFMVI